MKKSTNEKDKKFIDIISSLDEEEKSIALVAVECFMLGKKTEISKLSKEKNNKLKLKTG